MAPLASSSLARTPQHCPSQPKMGRKQLFTIEVKSTTSFLAQGKYSVASVALQTRRSRNFVSYFLKDIQRYGKSKSCGPPKKITPASERCLVRAETKSRSSASELREILQLPVSVSTI